MAWALDNPIGPPRLLIESEHNLGWMQLFLVVLWLNCIRHYFTVFRPTTNKTSHSIHTLYCHVLRLLLFVKSTTLQSLTLLIKAEPNSDAMDTNSNSFSSEQDDDCSSDIYYNDKSSPMWCTKYDSERLLSSSDDDELDLLKYTKRRRRRRSRQNLRKLLDNST